jgi:hypothetical protein
MKQKKKISLFIMLLAAASLIVQSCGKDNLKYPSSTLSGHFTYNGQPFNRLIYSNPDFYFGAGTGHNLAFRQVAGAQERYGVSSEVNVYALHDGSFTSKFFDGDYVYRTLSLKNPFEDFTNLPITIKGDTKLDIEVVPYWWMTNLTTTFTANVFTANLNLAKVSTATARTLQYVAIYLSPTNRPDAASATQGVAKTFNAGTNAGGILVPAAAATGGTNACTVKLDLSTLSASDKQLLGALGTGGHIWATIAVKTTAVTDALYSDPIQLQ